MADSAEQFLDIIDNRIEKHLNSNTYNYVKQRMAIVTAVDNDTQKVYVYFIDDENQTQYVYYNKTGETISEGDNVRVFYTSDIIKGWIGSKSGQPSASTVTEQNPLYISAKVANTQTVSYDKIERGLLSVDFNVDGTDSNVVFTANQKCSVTTEGDITAIYKVDGATQDFKLVETLSPGKRVVSHIYPMPLSIGKHNFSVYILSEDGGKGTIAIGDLNGVLSGQISGLKDYAPANDNLVFYYTGLPAGEFTLPAHIITGSNAKKYVDWGDGSDIEESSAPSSVTHTYANSGDYIITIKTDSLEFSHVSSNIVNSIVATGFENYLTRIYFPDNATYIGFTRKVQNTPNLETLVFGKSAKYIGWNFGSNKITSLLLPDTVTQIYLSPLNKTNITSLVVPKSVTNANTFSMPSSLRTLERYDSAKENVNGATGLQTLTIGGNATQTNTYQNSTSLTQVIFPSPSKVKTVSNFAFRDCSSLPNITIPNGVTTIGDKAFEDCSSLAQITIPESVASIGSRAFWNCDSLQSLSVPKAVTTIESQLCYGCAALAAVDLPGVKTIGLQAFDYCPSLTNVNLAEGLTSIGDNAFDGCNMLSNIIFPSTLTTIGSNAFVVSASVATVIPFNPGTAASITYIGNSAFSYSGITDIRIGENAILQDDYGKQFMGCKSLSNVIIEEGLTVIPSYCFQGTTSLLSMNIPSTVTQIRSYAFKDSAIDPVLPNGLLSIGGESFRNCGATSIIIPDTVTNIDSGAFRYCNKLGTVIIKGNPTCEGTVFLGCDNLVFADIHNLTNISGQMFCDCTSLSSVNFGTGVTIGSNAFSGCALTTVDILSVASSTGGLTNHGGIYNVGESAFRGNKQMTSVSGYEYKWDIYDQATHVQQDKYGNTTKMWRTYRKTETEGIYNKMQAIEDSVFAETALKTSSDYPKDQLEAREEYRYEDGSSYIITHSAYSNTKRTEPETEYVIG